MCIVGATPAACMSDKESVEHKWDRGLVREERAQWSLNGQAAGHRTGQALHWWDGRQSGWRPWRVSQENSQNRTSPNLRRLRRRTQHIQHYWRTGDSKSWILIGTCIPRAARITWLQNAYSRTLIRGTISTRKVDTTDLVFRVRSGFTTWFWCIHLFLGLLMIRCQTFLHYEMKLFLLEVMHTRSY